MNDRGAVGRNPRARVCYDTREDNKRGLRVPFVPVVPIIGILLCAYLMIDLPLATWGRFVVRLAIGLAIYFPSGARHSRLRRAEQSPSRFARVSDREAGRTPRSSGSGRPT